MEDVWALGGSCPRVEAQRAGSWRIGSGVEDQGAGAWRIGASVGDQGAGAWRVGSGVEDQGGRRLLPDLGY